jgi:hypothetical protein
MLFSLPNVIKKLKKKFNLQSIHPIPIPFAVQTCETLLRSLFQGVLKNGETGCSDFLKVLTLNCLLKLLEYIFKRRHHVKRSDLR